MRSLSVDDEPFLKTIFELVSAYMSPYCVPPLLDQRSALFPRRLKSPPPPCGLATPRPILPVDVMRSLSVPVVSTVTVSFAGNLIFVSKSP